MNEDERLYLLKVADIEEIFSAVNEIPDEKIRSRVLCAIDVATKQSKQRVADFLGKIAENSVKTISACLLTSLHEM